MKTKKTFALLLTLLLLLSMTFVGCSSKEEASQDNQTNDTNNQTNVEKKGLDYPTKPIEVIVPAGAGGDTDRNTRVFAKYLEKELGVPLVVTNVKGSGGSIGTRKVMDAKPDGYTVLSYHNSAILNHVLELTDYTVTDFKLAGIGLLDQGNGFIVNNNSRFQGISDLIEYAKDHPGEVSIATEFGGFTHLQLLAFQKATGVELNIVDVGGAADKIKALLGEQIDIVPTQIGLVKSYIDSGDFRAIGVLSEERLPDMPDVKTFKEQGVDIYFDKVYFWAFPPGTPDEIIEKFASAMKKVVTTNEQFKAEVKGFIVAPKFIDGNESATYIDSLETMYKELHSK